MVVVIKTSKDKKRQYYYEQHSVKINGKVVTPSGKYLGPVSPRRKKSNFGQLIAGGLSLAMGGGKTYSKKETIRAPDTRGAWIPDRIPVIQAKAAKHVPTMLSASQKADVAAMNAMVAAARASSVSPDKAPQSLQAATPSSASPSSAPPSVDGQSSPSSQSSGSQGTPS